MATVKKRLGAYAKGDGTSVSSHTHTYHTKDVEPPPTVAPHRPRTGGGSTVKPSPQPAAQPITVAGVLRVPDDTLEATGGWEKRLEGLYENVPSRVAVEVNDELALRREALTSLRSMRMFARENPGLARELISRTVEGHPNARFRELFREVCEEGRFRRVPLPEGFQIPPTGTGKKPGIRWGTVPNPDATGSGSAPVTVVSGGATVNPAVKIVLQAHGFDSHPDEMGKWTGRVDGSRLGDMLGQLSELGAEVAQRG